MVVAAVIGPLSVFRPQDPSLCAQANRGTRLLAYIGAAAFSPVAFACRSLYFGAAVGTLVSPRCLYDSGPSVPSGIIPGIIPGPQDHVSEICESVSSSESFVVSISVRTKVYFTAI